jgi:hypothetical protein
VSAVRLLVLLLLLVPWRAAAAQDATASPHGTLAVTCTTCHGADGWRPIRRDAEFDHAGTGFALDGAHASADCRACHAALDFTDAPRDCAGCHTDVHRGELGADCSRCHTSRSFVDHAGMVRLHQLGRFALTGAHAVTDCEACHAPVRPGALAFVSRPADCESCHLPAYQATTNPDHESGGFPRDCAQCHAATLWERARFNHSGTAFALTGAHRAVACDDCHAAGNFTGAPAECVGCHRSEYDATAEPPHQAAQFPVTCESCHNTAAWDGAAFDHAGTAFPLTGAHVAATCSDCHGDGVYAGKPSACVACHGNDYDGTTEPPHAGAGFPITCESCHTTTAWPGARFDHDGPFFPIYSGDHRGQWESCATCHTNPASYSEFSCLGCHEHSQTRMDDTHRERPGYSYESRACLSCHPRGDS